MANSVQVNGDVPHSAFIDVSDDYSFGANSLVAATSNQRHSISWPTPW